MVEEGGFSAAGKRVGRTQSAISLQIAKLEDRLNVKLLDRTSRSVSVTSAGTLPDGTKFADINGLKKVHLQQQDSLAKELVSSIFAYGLGRTISFSDQDDIEAILTNLKSKNYPLRDMIKQIAMSKLFQTY